MSRRPKTFWPTVITLWSLLWRAVLLTPVAMVFSALWLLAWPLIVLLPFFEIWLLFQGFWAWAVVAPVAWVGMFFFVRSSWFKGGPKDFLNDEVGNV